jgi:hypothetical protein
MAFTLTYRKGSFSQSETYSSLTGAIGRASVVLETTGCFGLAIDEDGMHLLHQSEIVMRLSAAGASQAGRPPLFRN